MKMRLTVAVLCLFAVATTGFGQLSPQYADFAKGPAQHLLTKEEKKQFEAITTDAAAKEFIDLFWARRDPTPATPENEFQQLFNERVKVADAQFGTAKVAGSATDRGKVFILLGSPTKIRKAGANPGESTVQTPGRMAGSIDEMQETTSVQGYSPKQMWQYEQGKVDIKLGQPLVEVAFIDQYSSNEWKMERVLRTDYTSVFDRVARTFITQPNLKALPVFAAAPVAAVAAAVPAPAMAFKTDALRAAIDEARAAKASSDKLFFSYGEYITGEGDHFVPVQLYVPKVAGLAADTAVTFFGAVEKAEGGEKVFVAEEPVKLTASKDAFFYARSLDLPAGSYVGTFGLAVDGKPVAVVSKPMTVQGLEKGQPSVSPLLVSDNVYALSEAQLPDDPFAFGGLKVVPKGDAKFSRASELSFFIEARNPGIDAATSQPKMTQRITISGTAKDGKKVKMVGASEPAQLTEVKGVPGHWMIGQIYPLEAFKPGEYKLAIKLTDDVLGKTYDLEQTFHVVE